MQDFRGNEIGVENGSARRSLGHKYHENEYKTSRVVIVKNQMNYISLIIWEDIELNTF